MTVTTVLGPSEGRLLDIEGLGVRFLIEAAQSGGGFSLVEHPLGPRMLGAPMHTHRREGEYSFVLEGEIGVQIADEITYAKPGDLVFKPRDVPHAFWNRTDQPARLLEIISPGGFEAYFDELAPLVPPQRAEPDIPALVALLDRYGLEMDLDSAETIAEREGLRLP
jgi:mannose-6-phosphate isomerase-like protein (cupin superfamily)